MRSCRAGVPDPASKKRFSQGLNSLGRVLNDCWNSSRVRVQRQSVRAGETWKGCTRRTASCMQFSFRNASSSLAICRMQREDCRFPVSGSVPRLCNHPSNRGSPQNRRCFVGWSIGACWGPVRSVSCFGYRESPPWLCLERCCCEPTADSRFLVKGHYSGHFSNRSRRNSRRLYVSIPSCYFALS